MRAFSIRPRSLRSRLVAIIVATAMLAVAALVVGVQLLLANSTNAETMRVLRARADAAASTVRVVDGRTTVLEARPGTLDQNIWVFDAHGGRVDGTAPPGKLSPAVQRLSTATRIESVVVSGVQLFARPVTNRSSGRRVAVIVASLDLAPYESAERHGLELSLVLGALIVLAAGGAAWASIHVSLHQVRRMVRRADDWREHDLSRRFDLGEPVDELSELGRTLDRMLDRIALALQSERRLTDEVAHELRTPLSVIRSEAQLALQSRPTDETPVSSAPAATGHRRSVDADGKDAALRAIVAATERMDRAITTMLATARLAGHDEAEGCEIADVLEAARLGSHPPPGVTVTIQPAAPGLLAAAPHAVVVAALAPLVDNAVRHAHNAVWLEARRQEHRILVAVRDDGTGVAEDDRERIFHPGWTTHDHGAGLGLALSRRLARSVGADVEVGGDGFGLFVLNLPAG